jgi:triacylglycerol lipase
MDPDRSTGGERSTEVQGLPPEMLDHVTGLADLLPQVVEDIVLGTVREVHSAVADRVFGLVPGTALPQAVHDRIAGAVYGVLTAGVRGTGRIAGTAARVTSRSRDPEVMSDAAAWRTTQAIVNGLIGDELSDADSPLAIPMAIRRGRHDIATTRESLAAHFPQAGGRVAVLLHGLMESDDAWRAGLAQHGTTYVDVLQRAGVTPVVLRYNTGKHISANGDELSVLLEHLLDAWPVEVEELLLIGHSMGGLVIRSAGESAVEAGHRWPRRATHVVTLGSPHLGAPLAKLVHSGSWILDQFPESAPFATILRRRSVGVRDLFHGYLRRADWEGHDPDDWSCPAPSEVGPLGDAVHHVVGATLTARRGHPVGFALGDVMVRWGSAIADGRTWAREAVVTHVGGADHFDLLNHPEVTDLLRQITTDRGAPGSD